MNPTTNKNSSTSITEMINEVLSGSGSVDGMIGETVNRLNDSTTSPRNFHNEMPSDSIFGKRNNTLIQTKLTEEVSNHTENFLSQSNRFQIDNGTIQNLADRVILPIG
jgi:hypothetical protein